MSMQDVCQNLVLLGLVGSHWFWLVLIDFNWKWFWLIWIDFRWVLSVFRDERMLKPSREGKMFVCCSRNLVNWLPLVFLDHHWFWLVIIGFNLFSSRGGKKFVCCMRNLLNWCSAPRRWRVLIAEYKQCKISFHALINGEKLHHIWWWKLLPFSFLKFLRI